MINATKIRNGVMNPGGIGSEIEAWTDLGFTRFKGVDGKKHWLDFCVHEGMYGCATLPCDWLVLFQAIAVSPFFWITVSKRSAGPPGFLTPRSQSEIKFFDTLR